MEQQPFESIPGFAAKRWPASRAGRLSLHEFLQGLHTAHGDIVVANFGEQPAVSIAAPELLRESRELFDRPLVLLAPLLPLYTERGIGYANGDDGLFRRKAYINPPFTHVEVQAMVPAFADAGSRLVRLLTDSPGVVPLHHTLTDFAMELFFVVAFGMKRSETHLVEGFVDAYFTAWYALDDSMAGDPAIPLRDSEEVTAAIRVLYDQTRVLLDRWTPEPGEPVSEACPAIIRKMLEAEIPAEQALADAVGTIIAGFHTTGATLTWALAHIAHDQALQEAIRGEVLSVSTQAESTLTGAHLRGLPLLRATIEETLRRDSIAPVAARISEHVQCIGGYQIPAGTPIIQALGCVGSNPRVWRDPEVFDPHRFMDRDSIPSWAFVPFGFAGKRVCPGQDFAYVEALTLLAFVIGNVRLRLVGDRLPDHRFGIVTMPMDEVYAIAEPLPSVPAGVFRASC